MQSSASVKWFPTGQFNAFEEIRMWKDLSYSRKEWLELFRFDVLRVGTEFTTGFTTGAIKCLCKESGEVFYQVENFCRYGCFRMFPMELLILRKNFNRCLRDFR